MVALTGIEGTTAHFSPLQLTVSHSKPYELVSRDAAGNGYELKWWALGGHWVQPIAAPYLDGFPAGDNPHPAAGECCSAAATGASTAARTQTA